MNVPKRSTLIKALKRLSSTRHAAKDLKAIFAEAEISNPRACALIWGALVEDALQYVTSIKLAHLTPDEKTDFFSESGPAGTFSSKIKIAYAMGAIETHVRDDINVIREIRNAFAHAQTALSFSNKEVADLSELLRPGIMRILTVAPQDPITSERLFSTSCSLYWYKLGDYKHWRLDEQA